MKKLATFLSVLGVVALAPLAHADYEIAYQIGAGPVTGCLDNSDSTNSTGTVACSGSGSGVSLTNLTGSSDSPGTPSLADEFSSSGSLSNSNTSGSVTIHIWYLAQDYTRPVTGSGVTGINFASNSSGTSINTQGMSTLGLESCVDGGGGGVGSSFCGSPFAHLTNTTLTYPAGLGGSVNNTVNEQFAPLTATYSLEQEVTVVLQGGDSVNYSDSQGLTPVPEPGAILLLGTAILGLTAKMRKTLARRS